MQRLQQSHWWHAILVDHQRLLSSALVSIYDSCWLHQSRCESRIVHAWCACRGTARRFFLYMASRTLVFTINTIFPLSSPPCLNNSHHTLFNPTLLYPNMDRMVLSLRFFSGFHARGSTFSPVSSYRKSGSYTI